MNITRKAIRGIIHMNNAATATKTKVFKAAQAGATKFNDTKILTPKEAMLAAANKVGSTAAHLKDIYETEATNIKYERTARNIHNLSKKA